MKLWPALKLVSAGGAPLTIYGSTCIELELEVQKFITDVVVVSSLTSEVMLGLDFLQEQQAIIDLDAKRLLLKKSGHDMHLKNLMPLGVHVNT